MNRSILSASLFLIFAVAGCISAEGQDLTPLVRSTSPIVAESKSSPTIERSNRAEGEPAGQPSAPNTVTGGSGQAASAGPATSPLDAGGKFKYFLRASFKPPVPYGLSILSGVFSEATDNDHGRHMSAGDFLADSMTHAARAMAFRTTANFFEKFAYASMFHQDPRYHRSDRSGFGRVTYAVSRVFITDSDSGRSQFNISFLAGGMTTAGISNLWSRPEDRTVSSTFSRFGTHIAYKALSNTIIELVGKK